jgi:hypothetical protein
MDESEHESPLAPDGETDAVSPTPPLRVVASGPDLWRFLDHPEEFDASFEESPLLYGLCDA